MASFDSERTRLLDLVEFYELERSAELLSFWDWDAHVSQTPYRESTSATIQEIQL